MIFVRQTRNNETSGMALTMFGKLGKPRAGARVRNNRGY